MKIGIDIDQVLAEFVTPFAEFCSSKIGRVLSVSKEYDCSDWGLSSEDVEALFKSAELDEGFYWNLRPIEGAQEAIKWLSNQTMIDGAKCSLHIVTARNLSLASVTADWVENHFSLTPFSSFHFTKEKGSVDVDILIDDSRKNFIERDHRMNWLFEAPYNSSEAALEIDSVVAYGGWAKLREFFDQGLLLTK